jgi:hypothetical protein
MKSKLSKKSVEGNAEQAIIFHNQYGGIHFKNKV